MKTIYLLKTGSHSDARIVRTADNIEDLKEFVRFCKETHARAEAIEDAGGGQNHLHLPYCWDIYKLEPNKSKEEMAQFILGDFGNLEYYIEEVI